MVGLRALIESAALSGQKLDAYHVGFLLAPRLNACGRLGHARLAVEMLTTATQEKAREIATYLEQQNRARQDLEKQILAQAVEQIQSSNWDHPTQRALVLAAEGWHAGVIGIVAARIVDRYRRPTIMLALSNGQGQGSARSIPGFHLARALESCGQHLIAFGGHEMAAGLRLESANLENFRNAFCEYASNIVTDEMLLPNLRLECAADLADLSADVVAEISRLGPFGHGNPKPLLCIEKSQIASPPRRVGKDGQHLQLFIRQNNSSMKCIAFGWGELLERLTPGTAIDLAVQPGLNDFNGRISVELDVKDIHFAAEKI
jgi:single-stranded-DNA-specific exonuclease